jgi:hypothetical protein
MGVNPNPIFLSEEDEIAGYRAIARVALFWGPVELLIEGYLVHLRLLHGEGDEPFLVSFSKKVRDLKDKLKKEPQLTDVHNRLRPLLGRAVELHNVRTNVVHCYFQGQTLDRKLIFGRSDQKRGVSYTDNRYTIEYLDSIADDLIKIHDAMEPFWLEISRFAISEVRLRNIAKIAAASGKADG